MSYTYNQIYAVYRKNVARKQQDKKMSLDLQYLTDTIPHKWELAIHMTSNIQTFASWMPQVHGTLILTTKAMSFKNKNIDFIFQYHDKRDNGLKHINLNNILSL